MKTNKSNKYAKRSDLVINFGKNLRIIRKGNDFTQEKLAHLSNVNQTFLGQIERGQKSATLETIEKICIALNIKAIEIFDFSRIKEPVQKILEERFFSLLIKGTKDPLILDLLDFSFDLILKALEKQEIREK